MPEGVGEGVVFSVVCGVWSGLYCVRGSRLRLAVRLENVHGYVCTYVRMYWGRSVATVGLSLSLARGPAARPISTH